MPIAQRAGSGRNTGFFDLAAMKSPNPTSGPLRFLRAQMQVRSKRRALATLRVCLGERFSSTIALPLTASTLTVVADVYTGPKRGSRRSRCRRNRPAACFPQPDFGTADALKTSYLRRHQTVG